MNLNNYQQFVEEVTSEESNSFSTFIDRLYELHSLSQVNIPLLLTSSVGLPAESGEFTEIVKKLVFQGKPLNDDNIFHLKRELGDIIFYWINDCRALNLDTNEVISENVNKLQSRYPDGKFNTNHSENRKPGDL